MLLVLAFHAICYVCSYEMCSRLLVLKYTGYHSRTPLPSELDIHHTPYWDLHVFTIPRHIGDRGRLLFTLPVCRVWRWGTFFGRYDLVPPCEAGVARPGGADLNIGRRRVTSSLLVQQYLWVGTTRRNFRVATAQKSLHFLGGGTLQIESSVKMYLACTWSAWSSSSVSGTAPGSPVGAHL